jgi:hypothetical protein
VVVGEHAALGVLVHHARPQVLDQVDVRLVHDLGVRGQEMPVRRLDKEAAPRLFSRCAARCVG